MTTAMATNTIFIYTEVGVSLTGSSAGKELHVLSVKRTVSVSNLCYHCICIDFKSNVSIICSCVTFSCDHKRLLYR